MGSYGHVTIDGKLVFAFKDDVPPTFMLLFRRGEVYKHRVNGAERSYLGYPAEEEIDVVELRTTTSVLRDRLAVFGFTGAAAASALSNIVSSTLDRHADDTVPRPEVLTDAWAVEDELLTHLTFERWITDVSDAMSRHRSPFQDRHEPGSLGWLFAIWDYADPRLLLSALVEAFPDSDVSLDVTDLVESGWLDGDLDPQEEARDHFGWVLATGSPAIVLAEGRTDIEVLRLALSVRRPHLDGFLRFADFEAKPEGGASALIRTIRSLAAAGVANTVVALFDNDAAARDALRSLDVHELPRNFRVLRYPRLELAEDYPTVGPTGLESLDVNGLAGSIEMYLGEDVLRQSDGSLTPVQWKGFMAGVGAYQGELRRKRELQQAFENKVNDALDGTVDVASQDWTALDLIFDLILDAVSRDRRTAVSLEQGK